MSVIDEYFEKLETPQKIALERIRQLVRKTAPEAEEVISYGMPGYKFKGKYLLGFAAFKDHLSLFPTSAPVEIYKDKLKGFTTSKGTIQFTPGKPISDELIIEIIKDRLADIGST